MGRRPGLLEVRAPPRPGPGHGRSARLPWPEEEQACGGRSG